MYTDGKTCIFGEHIGEKTGFAIAEHVRHAFTGYSCRKSG